MLWHGIKTIRKLMGERKSPQSRIRRGVENYLLSDSDFLSKMSIAYKEADETDYWLNLLRDNGYLNDEQFESLSHDCTRIIKILTSIVKTMRQKLGKDNHEPLTVNP